MQYKQQGYIYLYDIKVIYLYHNTFKILFHVEQLKKV